VVGAALDQKAREYARLLADPCHAPLVHPVYAGSDGGYVIRTSVLGTYGNLASSSTCAVLLWTPGDPAVSGSNNASFLYGEAATPLTALTVSARGLGETPGLTFLNTNASVVRCVAACIDISWAGTELNRQGFVEFGNVNAGYASNGSIITAFQAGNNLERGQRIGEGDATVVWRPATGDQMYTELQTGASSTYARNNALMVVLRNLPAGGSGVQFRLTAVYEYQPSVALGVNTPMSSRNASANTLDQVINYLDGVGDWVNGATRVATSAYRVGQALSRNPVARIAGRAAVGLLA